MIFDGCAKKQKSFHDKLRDAGPGASGARSFRSIGIKGIIRWYNGYIYMSMYIYMYIYIMDILWDIIDHFLKSYTA